MPKSAHTKKLESLLRIYPPEDVGAFLSSQRKWVREIVQMSALSPHQKVALLFIGTFARPDVPFCFASMDYICRHVDCERTTINRAVAWAEKEKYMSVDRKKRGGNVYRFRFPDDR